MSDPSHSGPPGFARTYGVELLYTAAPRIDESTFRRVIDHELPKSEVTPTGSGLMVAHKSDIVHFTDRSGPATTAVMVGKPGVDFTRYAEALRQTWTWRETATQRLEECTHSVFVTDLLSAQLPPRRRIELVLRVVRAVCASSQVHVIAWHPAGKLQHPEQLEDLVVVAVNARMFRDQAGSARMIMDTLGLAAVGLPDVQLDFHDLETGTVAGWLIGVGGYLLDQGDVIDDGHTVAGIPADSKWRCRHEMAIVAPERLVLDVDPGAEFSTRNRA